MLHWPHVVEKVPKDPLQAEEKTRVTKMFPMCPVPNDKIVVRVAHVHANETAFRNVVIEWHVPGALTEVILPVNEGKIYQGQ